MLPERAALDRLLGDVLAEDEAISAREALLSGCLERLSVTVQAPRALLDDVLADPEAQRTRAEVWQRVGPRSRGPSLVVLGALSLLVLVGGAWLLARGPEPSPDPSAPAAPPPAPAPRPWTLVTRPWHQIAPAACAASVVRTVVGAHQAPGRPLSVVTTRPHATLAPWRDLHLPVGRIDDDALLAMLPTRGAALVSVGPGLKELRFVDPDDEQRLLGTPR